MAVKPLCHQDRIRHHQLRLV